MWRRVLVLAGLGGAAALVASGACAGGDCVDEVCNGLDDDCNGQTDDGLERPCSSACGPGVQLCVGGRYASCSAPEPREEICDTLDNDCDGETDEGGRNYYRDEDGDTYGDPGRPTTSCTVPNGHVDNAEDCDDTDPLARPGGTETCDGTDQDCNGTPDDGCDCIDGQTQPCGDWGETGPCELGEQTCTDGAWGLCEGGVRPGTEVCNEADDDCDTSTDEGLGVDGQEPNDACVSARSLGSLPEGSSRDPLREMTGGATLYKPDGSRDEDWYVLTAEERSAACVPFTSECCYRFAVELLPPPELPRSNYRLCIYWDGECGGFGRERCLTDADWSASTGAYSTTVCWSGTCTYDDSETFYLRVEDAGAGVSSCRPYRLRYNFWQSGSSC